MAVSCHEVWTEGLEGHPRDVNVFTNLFRDCLPIIQNNDVFVNRVAAQLLLYFGLNLLCFLLNFLIAVSWKHNGEKIINVWSLNNYFITTTFPLHWSYRRPWVTHTPHCWHNRGTIVAVYIIYKALDEEVNRSLLSKYSNERFAKFKTRLDNDAYRKGAPFHNDVRSHYRLRGSSLVQASCRHIQDSRTSCSTAFQWSCAILGRLIESHHLLNLWGRIFLEVEPFCCFLDARKRERALKLNNKTRLE